MTADRPAPDRPAPNRSSPDQSPDAPGLLVLAGTPLGNPADGSPRLAELLAGADLVAAEDTRRLSRLLGELGVHREGPIVSYYEDVERERLPRLLAVLAEGGMVALVTDAGMPSVSDPGYRATRAALDAGHRVTAVPGPSAVTTALAVSGLPVDRFCFEGFLPRKPAERRARLAELADETRTQVYFEAPHRLAGTLADMAQALGPTRPAAACRELTKTYEEVVRDGLGALAEWAAAGVRGEITLVVQGAPAPAPDAGTDSRALSDRVAALEAEGLPRKEAIAVVARTAGLARRAVYDAVVAHKSS